MEALYLVLEAISKLISQIGELSKTPLGNLITVCFIFGFVLLIVKQIGCIMEGREQTKRIVETRRIIEQEETARIAEKEKTEQTHNTYLAEKERTLAEKERTHQAELFRQITANSGSPQAIPALESQRMDAQDVPYRLITRTRFVLTSKIFRKRIAVAAVALAVMFLITDRFILSPFIDVSRFFDKRFTAINWAYEHQITTGRKRAIFRIFYPDHICTHGNVIAFVERAGFPAPENSFLASDTDECTRGEFITYMWLTIGQPKSARGKKTLRASQYYGRAIEWAIDNKITSAASWDEFSPDAPCLRWHAVTFLYNARNLL